MKILLCGIALLTFLASAHAGCVWTDAKGNRCKQGTNGCYYEKCNNMGGSGVRG